MPLSDDQIIATILQHEGSAYTNDPADAGGPTKWGITLVDLQEWRRDRTLSATDVQTLTINEAEAIYRMKYIRPFDALPHETLRANVIDMGVNAGVRVGGTLLQELVGADVDGWIGPQTVKLAAGFSSDTLNTFYVAARLVFYEDLIQRRPTNIKWRRGWRVRALSFLSPIPRFPTAPRADAGTQMARAR
jgi:lysozyme family protein